MDLLFLLLLQTLYAPTCNPGGFKCAQKKVTSPPVAIWHDINFQWGYPPALYRSSLCSCLWWAAHIGSRLVLSLLVGSLSIWCI